MDIQPIPDVLLRAVLRYDRRARNLVQTYNQLFHIYALVKDQKEVLKKQTIEEYQANLKSLSSSIYVNLRLNLTRFPELVGETDIGIILRHAKELLKVKWSDPKGLLHDASFVRTIRILSKEIGGMLEVGMTRLFATTSGTTNIKTVKGPSSTIFRGRFFRKKTEKEIVDEIAAQEAPETTKEYNALKEQFNLVFSDKLNELNLFPDPSLYKYSLGDLVKFAKDLDGNQFAVKSNGDVIPFEQYKSQKALSVDDQIKGINPNSFEKLSAHKITREYNEGLNEGRVRRVTLSDAADTETSISKTFPVVSIDGVDYVAQGRFMGTKVSDLILSSGRLVEGSGYVMTKTPGGFTVPQKVEYETKTPEGELTLAYRNAHEPYIAFYKGQFLVSVPPGKENSIYVREMKKVAKTSNSVKLQSTSLGTYITEDGKERKRQLTQSDTHIVWSFDLESDFETIADTLSAFSTSKRAAAKIGEFLARRKKRREEMANEEYKDKIKESQFPNFSEVRPDGSANILFSSQKRAINFLLTEGKGVVGLHPGGGKTTAAICTIMKWSENGVLSQDGRNGKVLVVVDKSLLGNFENETKLICKNPEQTLNLMDVITYEGFTKGSRMDTPFTFKGKKYDAPRNYGSIVFDEAQKLKDLGGKAAKAAFSLDHPHKVLLTASLMDRSPIELYNLISIGRNDKPEQYRTGLKDFKRRFCNMGTGGKIIGIKTDRSSRAALADFVSRNAVATSGDSNETIVNSQKHSSNLPPLVKPPLTISLHEPVCKAYMETALPLLNTMEGLLKLFKELGEADSLTKRARGLESLKAFMAGPDNIKFTQYRKILRRLTVLQTDPSLLPEFKDLQRTQNAKYIATLNLIESDPNHSFILWTDSPAIAKNYGKYLSTDIPLSQIAVGLSDSIITLSNGKVISKTIPTNPNWAIETLNSIKGNPNIRILILTSSYTKGHNLQNFTRTIHLDQNSYSNETIKQRDGRNHRTGANPDTPILSYSPLPNLTNSFNLDEIAKFVMEINDDLFNAVIRESFAFIPERDGSNTTILTTAPLIIDKKLNELRIALRNLTKTTLTKILTPTPNDSIKE